MAVKKRRISSEATGSTGNVSRRTSPRTADSSEKEKPERTRLFLNSLLDVSELRYGKRVQDSGSQVSSPSKGDKDRLKLNPLYCDFTGNMGLGIIDSPIYTPKIEDTWSIEEIKLFEGAIYQLGKEFTSISKLIKTKTTKEVIQFYYIWKKSKKYKAWKNS
eukprot:snap_masked-scaffold_5-processed-gene-1.24-mRNA-1 protein AED:0.29 eAED:0.29 QI:0/-1/0/1/-1/1/1/0/160